MGLLLYLNRKDALKHHNELVIDNFTSEDGDLAFFSLIRSIYYRQSIKKVLDYGAGRNFYDQDFDPTSRSYFIRSLRDLRYDGAEVTAVDVSPAVLTHPTSDHQFNISTDAPLPFADETFDLIVSDFVFEHLERPEIVTAELQRVLRPGGWLFVRTPNRIGYVALITSLIPNKLHSAILKYVQPDRKDVDVFPTYYRINNLSQFKKYFPKFTIGSTTDNWEPQYFFGNRVLYIMNRIFHKCMPKSLGMTSIFYAQKNT